MENILKIGHRGAKGHLAENTMESIEAAIGFGVDMIEIDVHLCKTGELVVIHDFTLERTTNGSGEVRQKSLKELRSLFVEGKYKIPLLTEILDFITGKCSINIELKGDGTAAPVFKIIQEYIKQWNLDYQDFLVSSFKASELEQVFKLNSDIPLAVLTETEIEEAINLANKFHAVAINPSIELMNEQNLKKIKNAGFKTNVWTVNEPDQILKMKNLGVDGIISDFPDRL